MRLKRPAALNAPCDLAGFVGKELAGLADKRKAVEMAAYMKTEMPFYGVQKPQRVPIIRTMQCEFRPLSSDQYRENVLLLWRLPHREEKYLAINYAELFPDYVNADSISLYEMLLREGAWWDFVDAISANLVGEAYLKDRKKMKSLINKWSSDKDLWIRRASLICHLHHKDETDEEQLFSFCLKLSSDREFFIRKGIGWALREYSKTNPSAVAKFLKRNKKVFSTLSFKEASKHLTRMGIF